MGLEDILQENKKNVQNIKKGIAEKVYQEVVKPYTEKGYSRYTLFSFGSCNTSEFRPFSDIDMTLLLHRRYITPKRMGDIRKKFAEIENSSPIELHIHIGDFKFIDAYSPKAAIPSANYNPTEGWGDLANHYRLFYIAMTGKTEKGEKLVEQLKLSPEITIIPHYEGEELYVTQKRDAVNAFLSGIIAKDEEDKDKLKKSSNKMAKSILRTVEAFRIKIGLSPSWDINGLYPKIVENSKILPMINGQNEYLETVEKALEVKTNNDLMYTFDENETREFINFFNFFKKKFLEETQKEKEFIPEKHHLKLKEYSKATAKIALDKVIEKKLKKMYPVLLMIQDDIIEFAEEEAYNGHLGEKLNYLLSVMYNFGKLEEGAIKILNLEQNTDYLFFKGRVNLLRENYNEAEKILEDLVGQNTTNFYSVSPNLYNSKLFLKIGQAKAGLNKIHEAKKYLISAAKINPFDFEVWDEIYNFTNNGEYKIISDVVKHQDKIIESLAKNGNISPKIMKEFLNYWNHYLNFNILKDKISTEQRFKAIDDLYLNKRLEIDLQRDNPFKIASYYILQRELRLTENLLHTEKELLSNLKNGRIIDDVEYKNFLKFKWKILKELAFLETNYIKLNESSINSSLMIPTPEFIKNVYFSGGNNG